MKKINVLFLISLIASSYAIDRLIPDHSFPVEPKKHEADQKNRRPHKRRRRARHECRGPRRGAHRAGSRH